MEIRWIHTLALLLIIAIPTSSRAAMEPDETLPQSEYDAQLRAIDLPLIEIWTTDGTEPTATVVQAPEGMWGTALQGNEYVWGRMRMTIKGNIVYDSGNDGMRIRLRGNSSGAGTKKPYKVKLTQKEDLLFRGDNKYKDKDWVLQRLYDRYPVKVFTGLKVGTLVGLEWEPQWEYVNVVINGQYKGDYLLLETVEREKCRIDIDKSGYLIEDDAYWWDEEAYFKTNLLYPQVGYTFKYPEVEDLTDSIISTIKGFICDFEHALQNQTDITPYIDIPNWAAWLLAQDILSQNDSGGTNRYIYKKDYDPSDPHRTTLKMGPLWDFDASLGATDTWAAIHNRNYSFYYTRLLQRHDFCASYISQWETLHETLYADIMAHLHHIETHKGEAIDKSRALNNRIYPNDKATPLSDEIAYLDQWLQTRIAWLDTQLTATNNIGPAPTTNHLPTLYDIYGRQLRHGTPLDKGIYIINGKKMYIK